MYYCKCVVMASMVKMFDIVDIVNLYLTVRTPLLYDVQQVISVKEMISMHSNGDDDLIELI